MVRLTKRRLTECMTTTAKDLGTILVLGGTGKTGRRVVSRLLDRGVEVRVGSRSATTPFDWEDSSTWRAALAGVDAVYMSYQPDLAAPGAPARIRQFSDLAVAQGVQRLVLLSGRGEPEAQECEQIVQASDVDSTIVRCSWFAQNFSEDYLVDPVRGGEVVLPAADVPEPFVDTDDIADVAVAALTEDGHVGELYELTGPRLLTFADAVAEISTATGRDIRFIQVPVEDYAATLVEYQVPAEVIALLTYLFSTVLDGRNAYVTDGVERALGRKPRDFADFAAAAAASGIWAGE